MDDDDRTAALSEVKFNDLSERDIDEIFEVLLRRWVARKIRRLVESEIQEPLILARNAASVGYHIFKEAQPDERRAG